MAVALTSCVSSGHVPASTFAGVSSSVDAWRGLRALSAWLSAHTKMTGADCDPRTARGLRHHPSRWRCSVSRWGSTPRERHFWGTSGRGPLRSERMIVARVIQATAVRITKATNRKRKMPRYFSGGLGRWITWSVPHRPRAEGVRQHPGGEQRRQPGSAEARDDQHLKILSRWCISVSTVRRRWWSGGTALTHLRSCCGRPRAQIGIGGPSRPNPALIALLSVDLLPGHATTCTATDRPGPGRSPRHRPTAEPVRSFGSNRTQ